MTFQLRHDRGPLPPHQRTRAEPLRQAQTVTRPAPAQQQQLLPSVARAMLSGGGCSWEPMLMRMVTGPSRPRSPAAERETAGKHRATVPCRQTSTQPPQIWGVTNPWAAHCGQQTMLPTRVEVLQPPESSCPTQ